MEERKMKRVVSIALTAFLIASICVIPLAASAANDVMITGQPKSVTVAQGNTATFKVTALNATSYKWYYRVPFSGSWTEVKNNGGKAVYSLTAQQRHNGYQYRCEVKNTTSRVFSNIVTLTVISPPTITTQPSSIRVNVGSKATMRVTAQGAQGYQWYYRKPDESKWNQVSVNGTSAIYSLTAAARHNGYKYRCKVSNSSGYVYTNIVTLTVISGKPTITDQPSNIVVYIGNKAVFKVVASGAKSYQWYYRTSSSGSWKTVKNNGTSATYSLMAAERHNGYQYRCKVMNSSGYVYSKIVTLQVFCEHLLYKPIIYFYPSEETDISVTFDHPEYLTTVYPAYHDGWHITARPDGTIVDLNTNRELYALYYESNAKEPYKVEADGFIVRGEDAAAFLEEKLEILGLTPREAEEFIVYWLPKLEANEYNYIRFATKAEIDQNMPLSITPTPDSVIRIMMTFKPLEAPIDIIEQTLESPARTGFTVVEWGGSPIE